jgi:hypothetical protein
MTELSKEIFKNFQVRKTKKQKTQFIAFLCSCIEGVRVEQNKLFANRNLVIGNINKAKVILTAHYDTCAVLPFPNFLTPKNIPIYLLYNFLIAAVMIGGAEAVYSLVILLTANGRVAYFAMLVTLLLFVFLLLAGPPNRHTANDNTSGVITLCEIMAALSPEQREKTVFVFFDNEESGLIGSALFKRKHKNELKDKLVMNFDCVSDGDYFLIIQNKKARREFGGIVTQAFVSKRKNMIISDASTTLYPSDQLWFNKNIGIAAFKRNKLFGLFIDKIHTRRDTVWDALNIETLKESTIRFLDLLEA